MQWYLTSYATSYLRLRGSLAVAARVYRAVGRTQKYDAYVLLKYTTRRALDLFSLPDPLHSNRPAPGWPGIVVMVHIHSSSHSHHMGVSRLWDLAFFLSFSSFTSKFLPFL